MQETYGVFAQRELRSSFNYTLGKASIHSMGGIPMRTESSFRCFHARARFQGSILACNVATSARGRLGDLLSSGASIGRS